MWSCRQLGKQEALLHSFVLPYTHIAGYTYVCVHRILSNLRTGYQYRLGSKFRRRTWIIKTVVAQLPTSEYTSIWLLVVEVIRDDRLPNQVFCYRLTEKEKRLELADRKLWAGEEQDEWVCVRARACWLNTLNILCCTTLFLCIKITELLNNLHRIMGCVLRGIYLVNSYLYEHHKTET